MTNYTQVDLRMDYKKETGNCNQPDKYRHTDDYLQWLEENVIKYRDEALKIQTFLDSIGDEGDYSPIAHCDCGESNCNVEDNQ